MPVSFQVTDSCERRMCVTEWKGRSRNVEGDIKVEGSRGGNPHMLVEETKVLIT